MSTPAQSLTSLGWYQRALDEAADGRRTRVMRWFRGRSFLMFHLSLYAVGIVALFAIDLIRTPESLWVGTVALAWAALIVIHAAIAGLVWAVGLLRDDMPREAPEPGWFSSGWRGNRTEPQVAAFRSATELPATPAETEHPLPLTVPQAWATPQPIQAAPRVQDPASTIFQEPAVAGAYPLRADPGEPSQSPWGGWEPTSAADVARGATSGSRASERASWTEASAVAWLAQASNDPPATTSSAPTGDAHPDAFEKHLRSRLKTKYAAQDNESSNASDAFDARNASDDSARTSRS